MVCSDSVSTYVCGTAGYESLKWISSGYEDLGCPVNDSMSSVISMVWVVVTCFSVTLHNV